ncbi:MAG: glycosyltransferase family 4 protein [Actinomycetota bacterium]|nr:glycosyltransferase family 4 protein [Actinomycetota bacterium]
MRFGIVISAYHRSAGLERVAVEYARGLRDRGHDITVFAQRFERERADEGIAFVHVGGMRQIAARAATFPFLATKAVRRARLDNVLSFGSAVFVPSVVRLPGAHRSWWDVANAEWPVTTIDGLRRRLNPHHRITLALDRRVLGRGIPKLVLAAGDWAANDLRTFYPAVAAKVRIVPDGVNLDEFSFDPGGRARIRAEWDVGESPVLLTVATELRRKGLDTLMQAFRIVRERMPDARLIIGGRAPAGDVRALAVRHRVGREMRAVGFISDMRAAYSGADVLMFPTRFDPWGLPVVESLACGTPVAVSARAGAASVIRAGETGALIADPGDPVLVARATLDALAITTERDHVRKRVEHLAWPSVVELVERALIETA